MNVRYRVELSQAERGELTALLSGGKHAARKLKRAQILLAASCVFRRIAVEIDRLATSADSEWGQPALSACRSVTVVTKDVQLSPTQGGKGVCSGLEHRRAP